MIRISLFLLSRQEFLRYSFIARAVICNSQIAYDSMIPLIITPQLALNISPVTELLYFVSTMRAFIVLLQRVHVGWPKCIETDLV